MFVFPLEGIFADHEALGYLKGVGHIIMNLSIIETDPSKSFHGRIFLIRQRAAYVCENIYVVKYPN